MTFKDWWKSKPYWLRGGIIGFLTYLPILILVWTLVLKSSLTGVFDYTEGAGYILLFTNPLLYIGFESQAGGFLEFLIDTLQATFSYFLIGAFIGWGIQKIKSRLDAKVTTVKVEWLSKHYLIRGGLTGLIFSFLVLVLVRNFLSINFDWSSTIVVSIFFLLLGIWIGHILNRITSRASK